jgi:uncharacterized membrane protein
MAGAFAAGTLLGSMLHPWGGNYAVMGGGYVHQPFSMLSLLLDIVLLLVVIAVIRSLFRRSRSRY